MEVGKLLLSGQIQLLVCFFFFLRFIYLFLAALGLRCYPGAFSSCGKYELLVVAVHGFPSWWLLLLWSVGSRHVDISSCGGRPQRAGSVAVGQWA